MTAQIQGLGLKSHEPKVSYFIEPAGSLLDYLDTASPSEAIIGLMKSQHQAQYIFLAVRGGVKLLNFSLTMHSSC
jgi:hypothetical protein